MHGPITRPTKCLLLSFLLLVSTASWNSCSEAFFVPSAPLTFGRRTNSNNGDRTAITKVRSSIGGGGGDRPPPPEGGDSQWDDFFREESENLQRAREYMSENALPLNYGLDNENEQQQQSLSNQTASKNSSSLVRQSEFFQGENPPNAEALANNPYLQVVSKLSPSEMISRFTSSAHPRVQNAVRSTILSLIGGLPKMAFDTTTITTGQRLASLMFQLQMTGYMFKNAEYRLSLQQSLSGLGDPESVAGAKFLLKGDKTEEKEELDPLKGKVKGKIRVKYGSKKDNVTSTKSKDRKNNEQEEEEEEDEELSLSGVEMEVDAEAYMSELRNEVSQLRDELMLARKEKEEALRKDLLVYIRTLPEKELRDLSSTMSSDVLVAMKGLVNAVMSGIGEGQIGPDTVTEQSGEALAQLCMWQLVVGYNLRTLEVREEMKKSLTGGLPGTGASDEPNSGVDPDAGPGAFE